MNAAFAVLLETHDFDKESEELEDARVKAERFRMARRTLIERWKRPQHYSGIHRRRRKKLRI
jgi:hypothetical protein